MLSWILQISIISLVLIILVHYLFTFFKTNLTIPKVKDLVNKPQEQYEMLFNTIKNTNQIKGSNDNKKESNGQCNNEMKNELKNYLKELSSSKTESSPGLNGKMNTDSAGILTSDNLMSSNIGSSNYSAF
jgi:type II secretory pathway component PulC